MLKWLTVPVVALVFLVPLLSASSAPTPPTLPPSGAQDVVKQFGPRGRFVPRQISETLQTVATQVPGKIAELQFLGYIDFFRIKPISDQNFYIDLLATVEVLAQAWSENSGQQVTPEGYKALVCSLSIPLAGCRPKSRSNREKLVRVREALVVGAFASDAKRQQIRQRLTQRFLDLRMLEDLEVMLAEVDIEQLINLSDLLRAIR